MSAASLEEVWQKTVGQPLSVVINKWTEEGGMSAMLDELSQEPLYAVPVQDKCKCCQPNR